MARKIIIAIAIATAFLLVGWKAAWFVAQDDCRDAGGRWEDRTCVDSSRTGAPENAIAAFPGLPAQPDGHVVDAADVLSVEEEAALTATLGTYNASTRHPMVVATVETTGNREIGAFTDSLANSWGVGEDDRGVMVLLAIEDKTMRISVADGTLGVLPDARSAEILREDMTAPLRSGLYYEALDAAVAAIAEATSRDVVVPR